AIDRAHLFVPQLHVARSREDRARAESSATLIGRGEVVRSGQNDRARAFERGELALESAEILGKARWPARWLHGISLRNKEPSRGISGGPRREEGTRRDARSRAARSRAARLA